MKKTLAVLVLILVSLLVFSSCNREEKGVLINEAMSSNISSYPDENGNFSDWIELYNSSSSAVNLEGYMLSDNRYDIDVFTFPAIILEPGEHFVVFADKTYKADAEKRIIHVPFGISSRGESLYLFNAEGELQSFMSFGVVDAGKSIGLDESGNLTVFDVPTPGTPNGEITEVNAEAKTGLYINEYTTSDTQCVLDEDGDFVAFVEIYNSTDTDVNLFNLSLSDDYTNLAKWVFPDVTVKAKDYLTVYLSGKTKEYNGENELHATFVLKGKEERLYLSDEKLSIIDSIEVYDLMSNLTCGRNKDNLSEILFFPKATPGKENTQKGFTSVDSARYTGNKAIAITEVAAVNTTVSASDGEYYDYIELKNNTQKSLNLKDYELSDSKDAESFLALPDKVLKPGEYAVVFCGEKDSVNSKGEIFLSFGLNRYGETIYIKDKDGIIEDSFSYGRLSSAYCAGRDENGSEETVYYSVFTPKSKNPDEKLKSALANPSFSKSSTYVEKGEKIELTTQKGEIRYTTDGSIPDENSKLYTEPIVIKKNTVIRAKVFLEGYVPSDCVNATFLTERRHNLDVVFLTTDEDNLYDYNTGIWADGPGKDDVYPYVGANYWQDWERDVNFEYMTSDGVSQVQFDAGMKVFGQYSRVQAQKSVSLQLRDKYGPTEICYPFFEDSDVNVFSSLVLRNSGQDFQKSHIRDAFCAMVIKNSIDVDFMDYRPVVAYVNGEYHGIYDLREKIDEDYLSDHRGVDSSNVDIIKGTSNVQSGTIDNYKALLNYIKTHDMKNEEDYAYVCSQIDIDELISYWMCESFFTNTDTGNIRFYRENTEGAKWRWIFFDADWALYPTTYEKNYIENYLNPEGHGYMNMFSTAIMVNLMKNPSFRTRVLEIHSEHLKTTFDTERMLKIYDKMISEIEEEMKYHCKKWGVISYENWKKSTDELRDIISKKRDIFISHMKDSFNMTKEECELYL